MVDGIGTSPGIGTTPRALDTNRKDVVAEAAKRNNADQAENFERREQQVESNREELKTLQDESAQSSRETRESSSENRQVAKRDSTFNRVENLSSTREQSSRLGEHVDIFA